MCMAVLVCKAKRQYLLTCKVSGYCLFGFEPQYCSIDIHVVRYQTGLPDILLSVNKINALNAMPNDNSIYLNEMFTHFKLCYDDPQLPMGENYSCLFNLRPSIFKLLIFSPLTAKLFNCNFHPLEVASR